MDDDLIAVLAHGWVNSASVIGVAAETLQNSGDQLPEEVRRELLAMLTTQATFLRESMSDMLRNARPEVQAALDELLEDTGAKHVAE